MRCERCEIVRAVDRTHGSRSPPCTCPAAPRLKRTVAIVQHDLRDGAEQIFANRLEGDGHREHHRRNPRAHDIGDPPLGGREAEDAIGGRDQPPRKADPLGLIAIEQSVGCATGQDRREFPGEIDGVADPGIHALAAGRTVDVRGVAEQEGATFAEMLGHPVMHMIGREPVDLLRPRP